MLEYYVINRFYEDEKLRKYNIFNCTTFWNCLQNDLSRDKKYFDDNFRGSLFYCFCGKVEYEIEINGERHDVYDQCMLNYDLLKEYVWKNRKEFKNESNKS